MNADMQRYGRFTRSWRAMISLALLAAAASVLLSVILFGRTQSQTNDVQLQALANCIRANVNSAIIRVSASNPRPDLTKLQQGQGRLIAENLYPVLDCKTTIEAGRPVGLNPGQTQMYVAVVRTGRFPIVRNGRVVGSTARLLQGVTSFDKAVGQAANHGKGTP